MITTKVTAIAFGGDGIVRHEGLVYFIPFVAPEETIAFTPTLRKSSFAKGKLDQVITPSSQRVQPPCPYFTVCGGCQFQHLDYPLQLEVKRRFVEEALHRIAKVPYSVPPVHPSHSPYHYRRLVKLKLIPSTTGYQVGFSQKDSNKILPIRSCPLYIDEAIFSPLLQLLHQIDHQGLEGELRLFFTQDRQTLLAFDFPSSAPIQLKAQLSSAWSSGAFIRTPQGIEIIGSPNTTFSFADLLLTFSPYGFLQNHPEQSQKIYATLLFQLSPSSKRVLDLYCGIGITSLLFAKQGKEVIGVESSPECISQANENALKNNLTTRFELGLAETLAPNLLRSWAPDTVILNPPRIGVSLDLIQTLLSHPPKEIFYLSCMPSTLARDLSHLKNTFKIHSLQAFDMFPQTTHVETLVHLRRI